MLRGAAFVALIVVGLGAAASPARGDEAVDAAIVLAADVSRSIDDDSPCGTPLCSASAWSKSRYLST